MDNKEMFSIILNEIRESRIETNRRLDNIEHRLDNLELRMDSLEHRIDGLEREVKVTKQLVQN